MTELLIRAARGAGDLLASIGIRTIVSEGEELSLFRRGHPYLDEIMQDTDEGARAWEKALLRSPGCYRGVGADWGRCVYAPTGYLWCALLLGGAADLPRQ